MRPLYASIRMFGSRTGADHDVTRRWWGSREAKEPRSVSTDDIEIISRTFERLKHPVPALSLVWDAQDAPPRRMVCSDATPEGMGGFILNGDLEIVLGYRRYAGHFVIL